MAIGKMVKKIGRYDKDASGHLDRREVRKLFRHGLKISVEDLSDDDLDILIKSLDHDNSGTLDMQELILFLQRGDEAMKGSDLVTDDEKRARELTRARFASFFRDQESPRA